MPIFRFIKTHISLPVKCLFFKRFLLQDRQKTCENITHKMFSIPNLLATRTFFCLTQREKLQVTKNSIGQKIEIFFLDQISLITKHKIDRELVLISHQPKKKNSFLWLEIRMSCFQVYKKSCIYRPGCRHLNKSLSKLGKLRNN